MTDQQSIDSLWVSLVFAIFLILVRLGLRAWRKHSFTHGDYWCLAAAIFILARLIGNHILLKYGSTRTLKPEKRIELMMNPGLAAEAARVVMGSKLVLATRTLLILALWCLKMAVLDLLRRLIIKSSYEKKLLYAFWFILGSTFIVSVISVFVECRPFHRHWQIYPDPGTCVIGNTWLITYETSNIVTDVMLMAVPFSLIMSAKVPTVQRLRLLLLFSIGIFLIVISVLRTVQGKGSRIQSAQTLWASIELLFATIVAVGPTIFALARNRYDNMADGDSRLSTKGTVRSTSDSGSEAGDSEKGWRQLPESGTVIAEARLQPPVQSHFR